MSVIHASSTRLTLDRLLADHVVHALVAKQLLRVAGASHDMLRDELASAIAPLLSSVTPYLMAAHAFAQITDESFGDGDADEAIAVMIDGIGERVAHSNHVDDIFVDDATIRRASLRATRQLLVRYMRGELPIEEDARREPTITLSLESLGYLVATATTRVARPRLERVLADAGACGGAALLMLDPEGRTATFTPLQSQPDLLAIEESLTAALATLVARGEVELPKVEQEFELPPMALGRGGLLAALREAERTFDRRGHSRARCERLKLRRVRLSVTPLTTESALQADAQFEELVALVEAAMDAQATPPASAAPDSDPAVSRVQRRRGDVGDAPASTQRTIAEPAATTRRRSSGRR
ncbi:MAG: hypothetical protein FJ095_16225 [Deltaproteobacteria bacterium]|nr:hypothetical protein [Deltaproteobacteria bacterium]